MDRQVRAKGLGLFWRRYGGGAALTLLVVAGRLAMDPLWGRQQNRHLVFLPAVMLVAWLFGMGPGLLSAAISVAAIGSFWRGATGGVRGHVDLLLFFLVSASICLLVRSLQRARDRADAARTSREQVLAVVAHDLRNPLTTVMITASALQQHVADPEIVRRRLKTIDRAAHRMESLIRDLVDAAGIEQGGLAMTMLPEPVASIADEAIELHAPLAQELGIVLEANVPDLDILIACDRQRILQVLGNLLGNALKFTPPGGRVTLAVEERDRVVSFAVEDSGSGIDPAHLPHVFEKYWNADPRGIGLGLHIARSIVRAHSGDIAVRSAPGRGASFVFGLPQVAQPGPAPATPLRLRTLFQR